MTYGNYPDLSLVKKILVIKLRHHGDVLLSSSVFSLLKKACPDATIDAYIYRDTSPMLEGHSAIDELILVDRKGAHRSLLKRFFCDMRLLLSFRKKKYDMVINLTEGDRGAIVASFCGSKVRVGFERKKKNTMYTHVVKHCPTPRHTVEKHLDVLRCIGIFPKEEERDLFFHVPSTAIERIAPLVPAEGYVLIHPVSRWRFKCLPAEAIGAVISELVMMGKKVVVSAGKDPIEIEIIDKILSFCPSDGVVSLAGKTCLKELGALIQKAELVLCVDTVALHIASALKTPVVALFGPTSEINWGPWMHSRSRVLFRAMSCRPCGKDGCAGSKMSDCLFTLSPTTIVEAAKQLLQDSKLTALSS